MTRNVLVHTNAGCMSMTQVRRRRPIGASLLSSLSFTMICGHAFDVLSTIYLFIFLRDVDRAECTRPTIRFFVDTCLFFYDAKIKNSRSSSNCPRTSNAPHRRLVGSKSHLSSSTPWHPRSLRNTSLSCVVFIFIFFCRDNDDGDSSGCIVDLRLWFMHELFKRNSYFTAKVFAGKVTFGICHEKSWS